MKTRYAIEHSETGKLLKPFNERKCSCCGQVIKKPSLRKWTSNIDEALLFESPEAAEWFAGEVYKLENGPRRRPKVIEVNVV